MAGDLDTRFLVYSDVQGWMPRMDPLATVGWNMRQPEIEELRAEVEQLKTANELWAMSLEGARKGYLDALGDAQAESERLRAFVQKVALYSNDAWLAQEADELAPGASL